jgi:glycosyltransferase involved in cell wall biosynthesis
VLISFVLKIKFFFFFKIVESFKEVVIDNESGFLFDNGSPRHLAAKIEEIALDPNNLRRVAANTNSMIRDKYDWIKIGGLTKTFYSKILDS